MDITKPRDAFFIYANASKNVTNVQGAAFVDTMKAYGGRRFIAPVLLKLGTEGCEWYYYYYYYYYYFQLRTAAFKAYCSIWVRRSEFEGYQKI